ncbi:hypothetical protein BCR43DRAFT_499823 [Syncephalastrum racemosum]|uniref:Inhibitor I9 domain-containing protein n=1 Tax=Syncephalastrum racemosum TaxID=13706 RepID=A0A1X2H0V2_SYNRA|nr:hypothetical protein BCR43DRAFT_499823 [Syncephalastrum racemosum]
MPSRYIVTYKESTGDSVIDQHVQQAEAQGHTILHRYHLIRGFEIETKTDNQFISMLEKDENVHSIEVQPEGAIQ